MIDRESLLKLGWSEDLVQRALETAQWIKVSELEQPRVEPSTEVRFDDQGPSSSTFLLGDLNR